MLFSAIISVPILLSNWGIDKYGIWLSLFSVYTLLISLDFGHHSYIGNNFNILFNTDLEKFKNILGSSLLVALFLGVIQLFISILLVYSGAIESIMGVNSSLIHKYELHLALFVLITAAIFHNSAGGIIGRLLIPTGYLFQANVVGLIVKLIQSFSVILSVILFKDILIVCIVFSLSQTIISIFFFIYVKKILPDLYPWWANRNWRLGIDNFKKSLIITINNLTEQFSKSGLILVVSFLFGPQVVPSFVTIRTLTNSAMQGANIIITPLQPDITRYYATNQRKKLFDTFNANWFLSGMLINYGLIFILPFIEDIYTIWTKNIITFDKPLFCFLAFSIAIINFGYAPIYFIKSINYLKQQTIITFGRIIILGLCIYLFRSIGLLSIGIGILISEIFISFIYPFNFLKNILGVINGYNLLNYLKFTIPLLIVGATYFVYLINYLNFIFILLAVTLLTIYYAKYWFTLSHEVRHRLSSVVYDNILFKVFNRKNN